MDLGGYLVMDIMNMTVALALLGGVLAFFSLYLNERNQSPVGTRKEEIFINKNKGGVAG